jgi:hypothetical protein
MLISLRVMVFNLKTVVHLKSGLPKNIKTNGKWNQYVNVTLTQNIYSLLKCQEVKPPTDGTRIREENMLQALWLGVIICIGIF